MFQLCLRVCARGEDGLMGADLQILNITPSEVRNAFKKLFRSKKTSRARRRVIKSYFEDIIRDGFYFRDPYSEWNLSSKLGFSWHGDVLPLLDPNCILNSADIPLVFQAMSGSLNMNAPPNQEQQLVIMVSQALGIPPQTTAFTSQDLDYFKSERLKLLIFFEIAGFCGKDVECSL